MFRFRTIDNLLGKYEEFENQEIYFASLEELNDPMEGFLDIFWKGDEIVWTNFIKHYILCLEHVFSLVIISKKNEKIDINDIPIFKNHEVYPTNEYRQIIEEILNLFFKESMMKDFAKNLSNRKNKIRRQELLLYLRLIHSYVIDIIATIFNKHSLLDRKYKTSNIESFLDFNKENKNILKLIDKAESKYKKIENLSEKFFSSTNKVAMELDLITSYNLSDKEIPSKFTFVLKEFPEAFLSKLESIVYPDWYTACFMSKCTNSSVWGNYADNHKGVCLIFKTKTQDDHLQIDLETVYGWNDKGAMIGMKPHTFHKVNYQNKHVEIDFFKSLGRLQVYILKSQWYSDENGKISDCAEPITDKTKNWINNYWNNFHIGTTTKLDDWDYENEYRLIINNMFHDYKSKESRKLKYDFNDLEGIIFGIKTLKSDKLKIMKIIEEKCLKYNRRDFSFYQAYYDSNKGEIDYYKLDLLKFK